MNILVILTVPPYGTAFFKEVSELCLEFAKSNELTIFLYRDGVYNALASLSPASDEFDTIKQFRMLHEKNVKILFCETSGLRRGVNSTNTEPIFVCSTLGELSHLTLEADKVISF